MVVDPANGKTATAHDLRRAFGSRWSTRVMPAQLKQLMRHADIQTTMTYYVQQSARTAASDLWRVLDKELRKEPEQRESQNPKSP